MEIAGIISAFDKNSNYDRLFPNQDYHSGKGLGNLIVLPLQGKALENKNSCFIDPANEMPFEDQFNLLENVQRVSVEHLDNILYKIDNSTESNVPVNSIPILADQNGIPIILNKQIVIQRKQLTPELKSF